MEKHGKSDRKLPPEIRIGRLDPELHSQLINISNHKGITMTSMLKPVLKDFVDAQPDRQKSPFIDE